MKLILIMLLLFHFDSLFGQKIVVDSNTYSRWPSLSTPILSNDGKYAIYGINNALNKDGQLVVQSTDRLWKRQFNDVRRYTITGDSKYLFFATGKDVLTRLTLGTDKTKHYYGISSFELQTCNGNEWLCYSKAGESKNLFLKNIDTGRELRYLGVDSYQFSEDGSILLLWKNDEDQNDFRSLHWIYLESGKDREIWHGINPENLLIDSKHQQLVFRRGGNIWYYKTGFKKAMCIFDTKTSPIEKRFTLFSLDRFNENGEGVFLTLAEKKQKKERLINVEVWSYQDTILQTEKATDPELKTYLSILDLNKYNLTRLQIKAGESFSFPTSSTSQEKIALVRSIEFPGIPWSPASRLKWSIISVKSGKRIALEFLDGNKTVTISPTGKYLIYYDFKDRAYFSYELISGITRNLTKDIFISWKDSFRDDLYRSDSDVYPRNYNNLLWLNEDQSVLVYDTYDIWKLDPLNNKKPNQMTNGYGRKHHVVFDLVTQTYSNKKNIDYPNVYLSAFNETNKDNGFFRKRLDRLGDPERLIMGPYIFCTNSGYVPEGADFLPIKAKNSEMYIIRRMSATDAPNYFSTRDFKTLNRLSNIQPQKNYNWYTSELHRWTSLDGRILQGILYKPENFDPNKRYPVVFQYYERKSNGLNAFLTPMALCSGCEINIPTYVSNGYLVFCPDIFYKVGDPMQGTYDAVVSAAKYVAGLPFVDETKMGLQGCSFGGLQTNYLVTHTKLFAAAVSSSSLSNIISSYGGLFSNQGSMQGYFEDQGSQGRIGGTLWQNPQAYIKNSPVFQIDKVSTPLLMMHTKNDGVYLYANALEFFMGLRRMGKKSWMIVYPDENHGLFNKVNAADYSVRMAQFFDHYLRGKSAPMWMLEGVPTTRRWTDEGFELDSTGRTPGTGLTSDKVNILMGFE
ncbi:S9 family peptidase [Pedobacter panaciterrae]|uniref:alpha/beta hydrolase family protein n=1 Tax=Pedobacter panaciterrae TaxID=363849 RepID=UPI00155DB12A|nr:prolyl oligopeptidase family serine peptidase [Pedobacter panaciterrae]NQX56897.1 S9 family peptidase [Pedobacter panaciterrae]